MKFIYLFTLSLLLCAKAFAQQADMVLTNGNIVTLKAKGNRAQALAIKDQKIIAVGSSQIISKYIGKVPR